MKKLFLLLLLTFARSAKASPELSKLDEWSKLTAVELQKKDLVKLGEYIDDIKDYLNDLLFLMVSGNCEAISKVEKINTNLEVKFTRLAELIAKNHNLDLTMRIIEVKEDLIRGLTRGINPFRMVSGKGCLEGVFKILIDTGVDINITTRKSYTLLHVATVYENVEAINVLIKLGADMEATALKKCTPLHVGAIYDSPRAITALINAGANTEAKAEKNCTPLEIAVACDNPETIKALIKGGAKRLTVNDL